MTMITPTRSPTPSARLAILSLVVAISACFATDVVEDLPCSSDESCGPDHACVFGYCKPAGFDALAGCGDGQLARGEFCYPEELTVEVPFPGALRELAWGDLDGNGLIDAVTLSEEITLHVNTGSRAFDSAVLTFTLDADDFRSLGFDVPDGLVVTPTVLPRHMAMADFSGDGALDLVMALEFQSSSNLDAVQNIIEQAQQQLWLAEDIAQGEATLRPLPETEPFGAADILTRGLQPGDFDGDGDQDLVVISRSSQGPTQGHVLYGNGAGSLGGSYAIPLGGAGVPTVADFDGDGSDDLITPDEMMKTVSLLVGPLTESAMPPVPEIFGVEDSPVTVHVADIDDDGHLDALVGFEGSASGFEAFLGSGGGELASAQTVVDEAAGTLSMLATGDLDGDGTLDVITVSNAGLFVHPGYGDASFGAAFSLHEEAASFVGVFALDDDAFPDVVTGSPNVAELFFANP